MMRTSLVFLCLSVLGLSAGCSSSDDAAAGGSGSLNAKKLSELTTAEATQLCNDNKAAFQTMIDSACMIVTLNTPDVTDAAMCTTVVDQCKADLASPDAGVSTTVDCTDTSQLDWKGCDAKVGDLVACKGDITSYFSGLKCSDVGNVPELPACAKALAEACPDIFATN